MKLFIYEASARKDDPCYNTVEQRSKKLYINVLLTKEVRENLRKYRDRIFTEKLIEGWPVIQKYRLKQSEKTNV